MDPVVEVFSLRVEQIEGFEFEVRFDKEHFPRVRMDEAPPLGRDSAPGPTRYLAAAVGNCLAASLVFCLRKHGRPLEGVAADVRIALVRNARHRLRVGKIDVQLIVPIAAADEAFAACREAFEDFCVVTQSVRAGIPVEVQLKPTDPAAKR
jgi:uncharacterized OsmC-like protein